MRIVPATLNSTHDVDHIKEEKKYNFKLLRITLRQLGRKRRRRRRILRKMTTFTHTHARTVTKSVATKANPFQFLSDTTEQCAQRRTIYIALHGKGKKVLVSAHILSAKTFSLYLSLGCFTKPRRLTHAHTHTQAVNHGCMLKE